LFGAVAARFCLAAAAAAPCVAALPLAPAAAALPVEPAVGAPTAGPGLVTLPTVAGFVPTEAGAAAPPSAGAGFAMPPTVFGFVFVAPPTAVWVRPGLENAIESALSREAVTIALIFMGVALVLWSGAADSGRGMQ
jgi:hypothetical protein